MRKLLQILTYFIAALLPARYAAGQAMHFSQYYNAPMLLNPANTGLMPDYDYRVGMNFRNQWATIPVPYNTFSVFADFKAFANSETNSNWLGIGGAIFTDKAGDGDLSLTRLEGFLAYHIHLSQISLLSLGFSAYSVTRMVNFDNLTFDQQWDGATFNKSMANGEKTGVIKTRYASVNAGLNFAYFPNDLVYIKAAASVDNITQPKETFLNSNNQVGLRPTGNIDAWLQISDRLILNPSVYFTTQKSASEALYGSLLFVYLNGKNQTATEMIFGAYGRNNDAIIPAVGFQWGGLTLLNTYDITFSSLSPYNGGHGAYEISIIYQGNYKKDNSGHYKRLYNCPRFF